ncbi:type I polyketide synthase [Streptomyces sp. NRRL S-813]|uniref:type I polyketide synthase n=1 Tax=Streptomyces sp. NRRL S-813 TaxID=1463919 RepID=UPI0006923CA6|nr:type I polyketide synthase [Streptomyces sp. NRRL S-813]
MPLAVVGMGCRFPGAGGPAQFWENLLANVDSVTTVPVERFDVAADYDPAPGVPGKTASRHGGFVEDAFSFDHAFFGISPAEAKTVDPQQRMLLQVAWEALEHAGIRPSALAGTHAGVFVGQATAEYSEATHTADSPHVRDMVGSRLRAVTAGRLSFALDLLGPSMVLDTACSSSLVAVHAARQSLIAGECDLAIAAGVNFLLSSHDAIAYSQGGMLSPGGHCHFGAKDADGFVRSDGVGVVVLKRLSDAERDGDRILATVLGSAVNNDGRGSGLLLQPAISGQVDMLRTACRAAGITPDLLDYVEAHGTGTAVGDAVELRALAEATGRPDSRPLPTGSVKTNIGHAESAAGIAGLIKAILIARHGVIPASLHCRETNPVIAQDGLPISVVTRNTELARTGDRAHIGVSSFGISGTNAHVVVAEYRPDTAAPVAPARETAAGAADAGAADAGTADAGTADAGTADAGTADAGTADAGTADAGTADVKAADGEQLLVLSARSPRSLTMLAEAYATYLDGPGRGHALREICAAAALRRDTHPYRLWVRGDRHKTVAARLRSLAAGASPAEGGIAEAGFTAARRTAFVFPGQGSQWLGMGRGLLRTSPAFRTALTECDAAIRAELGWSVIELLTEAGEFPTDIDKVQPSLWAVGVSLAAALEEAGLSPDVCLGHSMGEIAASCVAGALSLRDAAAVICRRSRLMRRLAGRGVMLAVELSADAARQFLGGRPEFADACVAADNSPSSTVLAGPPHTIAAITEALEQRDVLCRTVRVEVASHSPDMDLISDDLVAALDGLARRPARTDLASSVLAAPLRGDELTPQYWQNNLRQPVRFTETVRLLSATDTVFVEVSPHPVLTAAVDETVTDAVGEAAAVATLRRNCDEPVALLEAVGRAFAHGAHVDWLRWYGAMPPVVDLPAYPWDATALRHDSARHTPAATVPAASAPHVREAPLTEWGVGGWGSGVTVRGVAPVFPSVYLSALLETAHAAAPGERFALAGIELGDAALTLDDVPHTTLRVTVNAPGPSGARHVRAQARRGADGPWELCAEGRLEPLAAAGPRNRRALLDSVLSRRHAHLSAADFYAAAERRGFGIGAEFRTVQHVWRRGGCAVARLRPAAGSTAAGWESGLLALLATYPARVTYVPLAFGSVRAFAELGEEFWALCRVRPAAGGRTAHADVIFLGSDGSVLAEFLNIELRALGDRPVDRLFSLSSASVAVSRLLPGLTVPRRRQHTAAISAPPAPLAALAPVAAPAPAVSPNPAVAQYPAPAVTPAPAVPPTPAQVVTPTHAQAVTPTHAQAVTPTHAQAVTPTHALAVTPVAAGTAAPRPTPTTAAEALVQRVARVLETPEDQLDRRRPLRDLGLDSLMATQLRAHLRSDWGLELTAGRLLGPESLNGILATIG